ncbi:uncharacterized protein DS421_12g378860 [Arachis hypogaea]|nr:uncharacterized protein DS421_12g378860 [Arachis hypogaea]
MIIEVFSVYDCSLDLSYHCFPSKDIFIIPAILLLPLLVLVKNSVTQQLLNST